ncbi:hypothetical protein cypCar_00049723 [Cyprinus carpio]|nr:hypothetical protein cypCar_00049723 [Cyprinus carpio]
MMQEIHDETGYLFFFKARQRDLCIDAQTSPMDGEEKDVVLFKALEDISVDTQLKFDYGVKSKSFRGVDLDWLDE